MEYKKLKEEGSKTVQSQFCGELYLGEGTCAYRFLKKRESTESLRRAWERVPFLKKHISLNLAFTAWFYSSRTFFTHGTIFRSIHFKCKVIQREEWYVLQAVNIQALLQTVRRHVYRNLCLPKKQKQPLLRLVL